MRKYVFLQWVSLFLCLLLFLLGVCVSFAADAPSGWATTEVNEAISLALVPSDLQQEYKNSITRLEFCRLAMALLREKSGKSIDEILAENKLTLISGTFYDTDSLDVSQAYTLSIVRGVGDNRFDPHAQITRQEAAVMLANTAKVLGVTLPNGAPEYFYDNPSFADWALESIAFVSASVDVSNRTAVMSGVEWERFDPKGLYTREQAFITMKRLYHSILRYKGLSITANLTKLPVYTSVTKEADYGRVIQTTSSFGVHASFPSASKYAVFPTNSGFCTIAQVDRLLYIEERDSEMQFVSETSVQPKLPIFGGIYQDADGYFYLLTGKENREEQNTEVLHVAKYDSRWQKVAEGSVFGNECSTVLPFAAGQPCMAVKDDCLVIYTSRQRYTSDDGLNHLSNLLIKMSAADLQILSISPLFPGNHVRNSFDQYVQFDGNVIAYLDRSDTEPRRILLTLEKDGLFTAYPLLDIADSLTDNKQNPSCSGFTVSAAGYLAAINSTSQQNAETARGIAVVFAPKSNPADSRIVWLTSYAESDMRVLSAPMIVKLSENKFVLLWEEFDARPETDIRNRGLTYLDTKYAVVDGGGTPISKVTSIAGARLADGLQPIVLTGNRITWYTINDANKSYKARDTITGANLFTFAKPYIKIFSLQID